MLMTVYSFLLMAALGVSAPWWLWRMATSGRYREGLGQRLGFVPEHLRAAVAGERVVWVHAVSVGEVLAAERLIGELKEALPEYVVAVSTTTATGQKIARERLMGCPVFYFPLDFSFAVRRYLRVLRPALVVLVESEFWPRLLVECAASRIPVAVVNARVSDRSFPRYTRLRWLWKPLLGKVSLFLAQGEESAERLRAIGAPGERVRVSGNLKYDSAEPNTSLARELAWALRNRKVVVAGSTLGGEEKLILDCWKEIATAEAAAFLILAPRHPQRFGEVIDLMGAHGGSWTGAMIQKVDLDDESENMDDAQGLILDTLGDLAAIFRFARVAFIGGSLVPKGGHNPLEAARFGVPIVMGPSYENFRDMVDRMKAADSIRIVQQEELATVLIQLLRDDGGLGARGREFFETQSGAVGKTVAALVGLIAEPEA
jgi:3-deoxy-D-manno-octulosonic-acid transferase